MEKTRRSASYFNNAYQGELTDQHIPARQYNCQGQPFGQRTPSVQNSYIVEPSEQHTPSRQHSYQGEPSEQRIPYRQHTQFDGVSHLISDQRATRRQYLGQIPHPQGQCQYWEPQAYNGPSPQDHIVPINVQTITQPGVQFMVRDSTTPMPDDSEIRRPIGCIITFRVISALFILLDISLGWYQVATWESGPDLPQWTEFLSSLKGKSLKTNCTKGSQSLKSTFIAFCAIATAYGLVRIINMVGETIIEYNKQRPSKDEPRIRGYQIIHGWVETVLGMACEDIPQAVLLLLFSVWCSLDPVFLIKVSVWVLLKTFKNNTRVGSCKQHYKPLCDSKSCCDDCCCVYSWNFICCCTIFIFRPCGCCCNKPCCETRSYELCPDLTCFREGRCCGEIVKDPEWAKNIYLKLSQLLIFLLIAMILVTLLNMFPIKSTPPFF